MECWSASDWTDSFVTWLFRSTEPQALSQLVRHIVIREVRQVIADFNA
jgi:hypothetical protein